MPIANAKALFTAAESELPGRRSDRPNVSVVFNSVDVEHDAALHERSTRWKQLNIETVIVATDDTGVSGRAFGHARVVYAPVDASHKQRRALGLAAASGDLVILADASQLLDDAWIAQLAGHDSGSSRAQA
ncbi:MAG TPA: hypothetical protein VH539_07350 [Gemmatimonadaceae bacterium]|jgi:hypothetical protein